MTMFLIDVELILNEELKVRSNRQLGSLGLLLVVSYSLYSSNSSKLMRKLSKDRFQVYREIPKINLKLSRLKKIIINQILLLIL